MYPPAGGHEGLSYAVLAGCTSEAGCLLRRTDRNVCPTILGAAELDRWTKGLFCIIIFLIEAFIREDEDG